MVPIWLEVPRDVRALRSATGELKSRDGRGGIAHHAGPVWKIRRALEMGVGARATL